MSPRLLLLPRGSGTPGPNAIQGSLGSGPVRVRNGISIGSSVLAQLTHARLCVRGFYTISTTRETCVQTDRQTDTLITILGSLQGAEERLEWQE